LDEPTLATAPGFDSNTSRVANRAAVDARVDRSLRTMTRVEAEARLRRGRIAYGFVNGLAELARHPALRRIEIATPGGTASIVAPPAIHDGATPVLGDVPAIGAHDAAIRAEFG
jgi:crotonobetainyl-CoA:carnitine CoA-transferase CaiB-like acyl-CoA transferase